MNQFSYERRCKCREEFSVIKNRQFKEARAHQYFKTFELPEMRCKTFQIKYEKKLSPTSKLLLYSFQKKYLYHAIDDILYLLKTNTAEQNNLLEILYSTVISLQNNFFIDFFAIWIQQISIHQPSEINKFLTEDSPDLNKFSYITIKLFYKIKVPKKKPDTIW